MRENAVDIEFIESYYLAYNREDPEALRHFYHDDVELTSSEGVMVGVEAILNTYRYLTSVFHDQMTPTDIAIDGDTAVVAITDSFEAKQAVDDFMGMQFAKGDSFELKLRGTYTIDKGKFHRITIEQLGN